MMLHKGNRKYSQSGQDAFVLSYFKNKKNGVFVDIGANDGVSLSNTYYLEKELGWTGVCFEPIPDIFKKLDDNRSCIKIMAGVAEVEGKEKFTFVDGPSHMLSGISKEYDSRHRSRIEREIRDLGGSVKEIELQTVLFNKVMKDLGIFEIDYLSLDTEGNEMKILQSIDWDKFHIKVMTIENNYGDPAQTSFIQSKGYYLMGRLEADEVFVKRK